MAFQNFVNEIKNNCNHITSINGHTVDLYYNPDSNDLYQLDDNWIRKIKLTNNVKNPFYNITIGRNNGKQIKISFTQKRLLLSMGTS